MRILLTILTAFFYLTAFGQYPIRNMLGVNVHPWDIDGSFFPAKIPALVDLNPSSIRIYYDADGAQDSAGNYALNPFYHGGWMPETSIQEIKKYLPNLFVQIAYQRQDLKIKKDWPVESHLNFQYKYNNDADRANPATYSDMAHDLAVLTTRGGHNATAPSYPVAASLWPPYNEVVKGAGFYDCIEGGNEWNAWWGSYNTNLNSQELAAAWVTMYDSVKSIDPGMLFTNGGIASDKPDTFLKAIRWWNDRGYSIPVDYFSYHSYPTAEALYGYGTFGGLNPESLLYPRAKNMVSAVGQYKPVVIGEWGYDVHPQSTQNAPAFGNYTAEQTRGNWSVRAILKFTQAGIYRAQWYRSYQDYPNRIYDSAAEQYQTMALLRQYDDAVTVIKRTLVGDYFKQLSQFGDFVFDKAIRDDSLQVLRFKSGNTYLYALWAVESYYVDQTTHRPVYSERKFAYNTGISSGTRYDLNEDSSGVMTHNPYYGEPVELSSKPFFILTNLSILPIKEDPPPMTLEPTPNEWFDYEVVNTLGQVLEKGRSNDITLTNRIRSSMQTQQVLLLHYWNNKKSFTDKIIKQQ